MSRLKQDHHGTISRQRTNMKAMTKKQLAKAAGVSYTTFWRWLQDPYIKSQLKPFKLTKNQHILPPGAVQIIANHYVIEID